MLCWVAALPAAAAGFQPWPGASYDPAIPTLESVVGHDFGADITAPADLGRYLEALASAAPGRAQLVTYARSWEGRPLQYLVIGSEANMARLDRIRSGMQRLADPRGAGTGELEALIAGLPAVVWLAHGVHGDEISSSDAALLTAYHLLAARGGETAEWLESVLVFVDPSQNPDGRARFVDHYRRARGLVAEPSPIAAERVQEWPGGRTNHYLFDMNRDWFGLTQPEVRGRVRAFLDYYPLVHVDLHEMGTDASYYFPPPTVPYNPYLADAQRRMLETLGRGAATAFDRFGYRYYTRETYDAYYPGYGDTWPALQGAAGMTFEMASAGGLVGQRSDGSLVRYRDGVQRHFVASLATVRTAATERERLLRDFLAFRQDSVDATTYVLPRERDPGRVDELAALLRAQGVEVRHTEQAARLCATRVPPGSYVVSTNQPAGRLAATLLAPESPADPAFWVEQERRAAKRLPVEVYDVVAWSLPLLYDVPMVSCRAGVTGYPVADRVPDPPAPPAAARVAYLVPWGTRAAARFLAAALRDGLKPSVAIRAFTQGDHQYPRGSLILSAAAHGDDLPRRVADLVTATGARVESTDASWVESGIDFGSERVFAVKAPHVALAWDEPTQATSAGAWRFLLERKLGYPVAPVRVRDLGSAWLDQFDVLILPEGDGYARALGEDATGNLARWVRRGGTLIGIGAAVEFLASKDVDLLSVDPELRAPADEADDEGEDGDGAEDAADDAEDDEDAAAVPGSVLAEPTDLRHALEPREERPPEIPGVLLQATVDPDHWLSAGLPEQLPFMVTGHLVVTPLRLDKGTNVASFGPTEALPAAGRLWDGAARQLAHKPVVLVEPRGRGQVIGFVADPSFRGLMNGLDVLVANALFFGPALTGPVPAPPPPG